jgi:hypothetical protein
MFRVPLSNPAQKRTLQPKYANTQATAWAGFLDPEWDNSFDIYPGTVMTRVYGNVVRPFTGAEGEVPFGLSALFVAPVLGINELITNSNVFTVWIGDGQAEFEVLAPAFDQEADWVLAGNGGRQLLTATSEGLLTPTGVNNGNAVAELVDIPSTDKLVITLNRIDLATTVAVAGGC